MKKYVCIESKEDFVLSNISCTSEDSNLACGVREVGYILEALIEAENALADYIPTLEAKGLSLNYGRSVLEKARDAIAKSKER